MLLWCKIETVTQITGNTVEPWYGVWKSWDINKLLLGGAQTKTRMHQVNSKLMQLTITSAMYFLLLDYSYGRTIFKNQNTKPPPLLWSMLHCNLVFSSSEYNVSSEKEEFYCCIALTQCNDLNQILFWTIDFFGLKIYTLYIETMQTRDRILCGVCGQNNVIFSKSIFKFHSRSITLMYIVHKHKDYYAMD